LARAYDAVIRVNSQSGKGVHRYLLERDFRFVFARLRRSNSARSSRHHGRVSGKELSSIAIKAAFDRDTWRASALAYVEHRNHA